ncbi:MAG: hypothetical protein DMF54_07220 [Acidobacteria bacterium]|nr:MAG: hypothetical protein DMF54_07220 [Acidobacteriota bacterium]
MTVRSFIRVLMIAAVAAGSVSKPATALCSSCCGESSPEPGFASPMACCDDTCAPTIRSARPTIAALAAASCRLDRPMAFALRVAVSLDVPRPGIRSAPTVSIEAFESPPRLPPVLRL